MEDGLVPSATELKKQFDEVLILVVVEDGLVLELYVMIRDGVVAS